ncbi:MAG: protein kinase [Elusimicrobiota bacterium]
MAPSYPGRVLVVGACVAAVLCLTGPPAAAKGKFSPEQAQIIGEYSSEIAKIPRELYGDSAKLQAFIRNDPELSQLEPNKGFQSAIAILAGIRRGRPQGGGAARPDAEAATAAQEEYFRLLSNRVSDQVWVFVEVGRRAFERKDYLQAFRDYEKALMIDAANSEALLGYGHSANELGDHALAVRAAREMLKNDPGSKDALGLYHFANDRAPVMRLPSAVFTADRGAAPVSGAHLPVSPPPGPAAPAAGGAGSEAGVNERSAQLTRDARAALRLKDFPAAHELASRALGLNSRNAQALNFRAIALNRMSRFAEAASDAGAALALAPGNSAALQTRSWAFAKQGLYREALRDAEETLVRDSANAFAYQNKALALAGLRDRAGALEALRQSAARDERFKDRYERALQLPQDTDLTLLFGEENVWVETSPPTPRRRRFFRLATLTASGGMLIALGLLHIFSAGLREKVRVTVRRVLRFVPMADPFKNPSATSDSPFWTQYLLVKEIALGGMGVVYEARDRALERRVAVKKMRDEIRIDPQERRRFINEARMVARLHHPNIVDIYAISEEADDVYLVFEYVEGRTLQDQIKSEGPLDPAAARGVLRAAAEAVEHAHAHHIVHRDLKPSNIMITPDGRVKVMDFGVARQAKDALTKMSVTATVAGTPPYMAPEQEQGSVGPESDVYALAVCLYEMLTGCLPFAGTGATMALHKINGRHVPITERKASLPQEINPVMAKALAPDPARRYRTPTEFVAAVDAVLGAR